MRRNALDSRIISRHGHFLKDLVSQSFQKPVLGCITAHLWKLLGGQPRESSVQRAPSELRTAITALAAAVEAFLAFLLRRGSPRDQKQDVIEHFSTTYSIRQVASTLQNVNTI